MSTTYDRYLDAYGRALQNQTTDIATVPRSDLLSVLRGIDDGMAARTIILSGIGAARHPLSESMLAGYVASVNGQTAIGEAISLVGSFGVDGSKMSKEEVAAEVERKLAAERTAISVIDQPA